VAVSDIDIIGRYIPVKSRSCDRLLCGFTSTRRSGTFAVFLKHLKEIIARRNDLNLRYTDLKYMSSSALSLADTNSSNLIFVI
jgi:hypothetical protein